MARLQRKLRRFLWRLRSRVPASAAVAALALPLLAAAAAATQASRVDPDQLRSELALMEVENQALMTQAKRVNRRREEIERSGGRFDLEMEQALVLLFEKRCGIPRELYKLGVDADGAVRARAECPPLSGLCLLGGLRGSGLRGGIEWLEVDHETFSVAWQGTGDG